MRIALGVCGGIAAYKAAELVRRLQQERLEVQMVMTRSAREFVTPLTFAALTGQKVITEMFAGDSSEPANIESAIEHIAVAQRIELLVVAPATANVLAKFAHGVADDFLTTLYLATKAPVVVAPAMNVQMWEHVATQENVATLRARGVHVIEPDEGYLACGMTGAGRLAAVETIAQKVCELLGLRHDLLGETVLVTAGPTREAIDPVRYITNRSSGKMGYAMADAAARRGARVILVSGPVNIDPPVGVEVLRVETSAEMRAAVLEHSAEATIIVKAAAVADFRPVSPSATKIRRGKDRMTLELEPTVDILAEVARHKGERILVGFAAETEDIAARAQEKLRRKDADIVVANDVTREGAGFDADTNIVTIFTRHGERIELPKLSKLECAYRILDEVLRLRRASGQPAEVESAT
jgi:phosphopantothenoylcysteine decarboxylase/phosphopantothenate--cysteine ligase